MSQNTSKEIFRKNLESFLNLEPHPSMRNLSTVIGASDSYIQKILNKKTAPSFEKIDSICEYFDVEPWEMFFEYRDDSQEIYAVIQILNRMPEHSLPAVKAYLEFMQKQIDQLNKSEDS